MHLNQADLKVVCGLLLDDFQGMLSWQWDARFEALASVFETDGIADVRAVLARHLDRVWDPRSVDKAPVEVRACLDSFGDLRRGQLLFASDPDRPPLVVGAWWPWGDGKTISLRLAAPSDRQSENRSPGFFSRIRGLFS